MDMKVGDKVFIVFTEDLEAEIEWGNRKTQMRDFKKGEYPMDPFVVLNVDEDMETVDFSVPFPYIMPECPDRCYDGTIYSVPREFFSVVKI